MNKKRIALITTWFPPKKSVAVNRMQAFAKYLSDDYEIVIFIDDEQTHQEIVDGNQVFYISSDSFLNNLSHKTDDNWLRHNTISLINVIKLFLGYSTLKKWIKNTSIELNNQHKNKPFDIIISSYAPFGPHKVAANFVKENAIPWIADMRDEMSKSPFASFGERKVLQKQEHLVNQYAKAVTSVSYPILEDFKSLMPDIRFFEEIRNGFDHNYQSKEIIKNEVYTIGYVGNFYGEIKPNTFFEALQNVLKKESISIKVKIIGAHKTFSIPKSIINFVEMVDKVPYINAIEMMANMDANLLIHPSGKRKGVYTGKLFDYISVSKPIIGVIDKEDVAAELINNLDCGYLADFYDITEIESIILKAYQDWKDNIFKVASPFEIEKLHRKNEIQKLKKLIDKIS